MRFICAGVMCLALAATASAQNMLTNGGFQNTNAWVQIGPQGGYITAATGFGIIPTQNTRAWASIYSFGAGGPGVYNGVYQQITGVGAGTYMFQADVIAHNRSDAFLWVANQASSAPNDTVVRFGYDLTGGTNPNGPNVVLSPPINTGAQWSRRRIQFTKNTAASTITVFLLTEAKVSYPGNWAGFDNSELRRISDCPTVMTVTSATPTSLNTPQGLTVFTLTGTNLDQHNGTITLFGPQQPDNSFSVVGNVTSATSNQLTAEVDLSSAGTGVYDIQVSNSNPIQNCRQGLLSGAFTYNCSCPPTTVAGIINDYGLQGTQHTIKLVGSNLSCLTGVKLRKSRDGGAEINAINLTMNAGNLDVTFDLTGAEGGRYDVVYQHPCQQVTPAQGTSEGFLVYLSDITNGSFEEGYTADPTTGSVCANPAANGNRPKAKHWDQRLVAASALEGAGGGHKRDGNVWFPACIGGQIKHISGEHYNGIDVITTGTNPMNQASFFQTIAAPYVNVNGVSTKAYNVRAEMAINGANSVYPATGIIRVFDGTDKNGVEIASTVISSKFESDDDFGLVSDPSYNVEIPAGQVYTSNPPVLTIEFAVTTSANSPVNTQVGFWVDNVRTGPYTAPGCNLIWADADNDGDVDQDDFGVFQLCITGPTPGLPADPDYCTCFDRTSPVNVIDVTDFNEFKKCVSGPNVPWSPAVAPDCVN